jgi:hypothetical protein
MKHAELKKLAEAAKDRQLGTLTIPIDVVLGLLAEIAALLEALKLAERGRLIAGEVGVIDGGFRFITSDPKVEL